MSPTWVQANPNTCGSESPWVSFPLFSESDPESSSLSLVTNLQVGQARDEGSHAPTRDGRSVEAEVLQLLKAPQR